MNPEIYPTNPILIVDDEKNALRSYKLAFLAAGINNVILCSDSREVEPIVARQEIELVVLDIIMPHLSGLEVLRRLSEEHPQIPVLMASGVDSIDAAVESMKLGALDYILKPVNDEKMIKLIKSTLEVRNLKREGEMLEQLSKKKNSREIPKAFDSIKTCNEYMFSLFRYCDAVAKSSQSVLITGETGVGKELFARAIHDLSECKGRFVAVNIAGVDDNLLSDTLFGHEAGAFTGAQKAREGMVAQASGGTLFIDEIGDMSIASQIKLLRLMQEHEYSPLGSDEIKRSDARILLATHCNLLELQRSNEFRKDLYYRISTHHIHVPPLRERNEDMKILFEDILNRVSAELGKKPPSYHPELISLLKTYAFPGNVRELEAMTYDAVSNHDSKMLSTKIFERHILRNSSDSKSTVAKNGRFTGSDNIFSRLDCLPKIKDATNLLIDEALQRANNNQSIAAKMLGISPQAMNARLKKRQPQKQS